MQTPNLAFLHSLKKKGLFQNHFINHVCVSVLEILKLFSVETLDWQMKLDS